MAERFLRPHVDRVAGRLRNQVRARAPEAKSWLSARDERVRPSHVTADGQTIPANIPFILPKAGGAAGEDLADHPRDPNLPIGNRANCRCSDPTSPAVAASIRATDPEVFGTRVRAEVYTRFTRAAESEFTEVGGGWMGGAADVIRDG